MSLELSDGIEPPPRGSVPRDLSIELRERWRSRQESNLQPLARLPVRSRAVYPLSYGTNAVKFGVTDGFCPRPTGTTTQRATANTTDTVGQIWLCRCRRPSAS